ncbi:MULTISPECIES: hypothetical protein [unclassified Bradyrhizobium]
MERSELPQSAEVTKLAAPNMSKSWRRPNLRWALDGSLAEAAALAHRISSARPRVMAD